MSSNFLQLNSKKNEFLVIGRVSEDVTFLCVCVPLVQQVFSKIMLSPFCYTYRKGPLSSLTPVKYMLESPFCTLFIPMCRAGNSRDSRERDEAEAQHTHWLLSHLCLLCDRLFIHIKERCLKLFI